MFILKSGFVAGVSGVEYELTRRTIFKAPSNEVDMCAENALRMHEREFK